MNTPDVMSFYDVVLYCLCREDFVREYNRLMGTSILKDTRRPIELLIDKASGYQETFEEERHNEIVGFVNFIWLYVWLPLTLEVVDEKQPSA